MYIEGSTWVDILATTINTQLSQSYPRLLNTNNPTSHGVLLMRGRLEPRIGQCSRGVYQRQTLQMLKNATRQFSTSILSRPTFSKLIGTSEMFSSTWLASARAYFPTVTRSLGRLCRSAQVQFSHTARSRLRQPPPFPAWRRVWRYVAPLDICAPLLKLTAETLICAIDHRLLELMLEACMQISSLGVLAATFVFVGRPDVTPA